MKYTVDPTLIAAEGFGDAIAKVLPAALADKTDDLAKCIEENRWSELLAMTEWSDEEIFNFAEVISGVSMVAPVVEKEAEE
eukprot:4793999-Amphidinium_carterae.2